MNFSSALRTIAFAVIVLGAAPWVLAQADTAKNSRAELMLLRSQNERLLKENAALRAEIAALKDGRAAAPATNPSATTRPISLSNAAQPKRVVFILDTSGSMLNAFDGARGDLRKAIEELKPDQFFAVVLDGDQTSPFPKILGVANNQNKEKIIGLLEKLHPRGSDKFAQAMRSALVMNPDLIWWIGDSPNDYRNDLVETKRMNVKKVKINASPRNMDAQNQGRSQWFGWTLASDSGGVCFDEKGNPITEQPSEPPPDRAGGAPPPSEPPVLRINPNTELRVRVPER